MAFKILWNFLRRLIAQSLKYYQKFELLNLLLFLNTAAYRNTEQTSPSLHLLTLRETVSAHVFMLIGVKNLKITRNMSTNNEIHKSHNRTEIVSSDM